MPIKTGRKLRGKVFFCFFQVWSLLEWKFIITNLLPQIFFWELICKKIRKNLLSFSTFLFYKEMDEKIERLGNEHCVTKKQKKVSLKGRLSPYLDFCSPNFYHKSKNSITQFKERKSFSKDRSRHSFPTQR